MLWGYLDVKPQMTTKQQLWECKNLMKIVTTQLRLLVYLHTNYGNMHQPTTKLHYKTLCNTITMIIINIHITWLQSDTNTYIQKFWKQTIARDASLCYGIITLFHIILTLQIMPLTSLIQTSRSVIFLSPQGMDHSVYARSQSDPALQYSTGSDWPSAYKEWSLQGFQI